VTLKKIICLSLLAFIVLISVPWAADDHFEQVFRDSLLTMYDLNPDKTEISIVRNRLNIGKSAYDALKISPLTTSEPRGTLPFKVTLFLKGRAAGEGQIRIKIAHFENVLVTSDRIRRQSPITADKYEVERREITRLTERPVLSPADLVGKWARRNISKGQILTSGMLEMIPDVTPGSKVSIQYKTSAFEITALGIVMEPGYRGDVIRVKNSHSRKIIACTVIDETTVQVSSH
jgi:flagella basal body P-ring formation protein FlgA